ASPAISNLLAGVYKFKLTVSDGTYTDFDEVLVIVSASGNLNPTVSITSPANNASFKEGQDITITTIANDLDGTVSLVEFFDGSTKLGEDATSPFSFVWSGAAVGNHQITAVATDNNNGKSTSQVITVSVAEEQLCSETSSIAQQGSFSRGYEVTFETIGTSVNITFKLLDTDKTGVVAYLWRQSPFSESQLNQVSGLTFSRTITGLTIGETISYACKFAFGGGSAVTKYFSYKVGDKCTGSNSDVAGPENFTASVGTVTATTVQLLLNATDNSGKVIYEITYGNTVKTVNADSGVQQSVIINNLNPETAYSFSITAEDLSGNLASNTPIVLQATTIQNTNSQCSGSSSEAIQGSFSTGYNYEFVTNGTDVTFTFELLDTDKVGVVAYLWKQTPFGETAMTLVSGKRFSKTLSGFTNGQTISYACKFAFAGGLAVTKYLTYVVGSNCAPLSVSDNILEKDITLYPNPATNQVTIRSKSAEVIRVELYSTLGTLVKKVSNNKAPINIEEISSGLYLVKIYTEKGIVMKRFLKN
ncbi:MAG: Ig-like domain-containing protein, partial [Polaribacter sp.]|nr:Ig-like domain-containing protein [Polaribacter sp.]